MRTAASIPLPAVILFSLLATPAVAPWPPETTSAKTRSQVYRPAPRAQPTPSEGGNTDRSIASLLERWEHPRESDRDVILPWAPQAPNYQKETKKSLSRKGPGAPTRIPGDDEDDVPDPGTNIIPGHEIGEDVLFAGEWEPLLAPMSRLERQQEKQNRLPEYGDWGHVLTEIGQATARNYRSLVEQPHVMHLLEKGKDMDTKVEGLGVFDHGGYNDKTEHRSLTYVNWDQFKGQGELQGVWKKSDFFEFLESANRILRQAEDSLSEATQRFNFISSNEILADYQDRVPPSGSTKANSELERVRREEQRAKDITVAKTRIDELLQTIYNAGIYIEHLLTYTASALQEMFPASDFSVRYERAPWEKLAVYDFMQYYDVRAAQTLLQAQAQEPGVSTNTKIPQKFPGGPNGDLQTYFRTNPGFVWILVRAIGYEQHQWMALAAAMYPELKKYKARILDQYAEHNLPEIPYSNAPSEKSVPIPVGTSTQQNYKTRGEGALIPEKQLRNLLASIEPLVVMSTFMYRTSQRNRNRSPMYRFNAILGEWLLKTYKKEYDDLREIFRKRTRREYRDVEAEYKGKIWLEGEEERQAKAAKEDALETMRNKQLLLKKKKRPLKHVKKGKPEDLEEDYTRLLDDPELKQEPPQEEDRDVVINLDNILPREDEEDDDEQKLLTTTRAREYRDRKQTEVLPSAVSPQWSEKMDRFITQQRATSEAAQAGGLSSIPDTIFATTQNNFFSSDPRSSPHRFTVTSRPLSPKSPEELNSFYGAGGSNPLAPKSNLNINIFGHRGQAPEKVAQNEYAGPLNRFERRPQVTEVDEHEVNDVVGFLPGQQQQNTAIHPDKLSHSRQLYSSSTSKRSSINTGGNGMNPMIQGVFASPRDYFSKQTISKQNTQRDITLPGMNDEFYDSVKSGGGGTDDNTEIKWGLSMSNKPGSGLQKPTPRSYDLINPKFGGKRNEGYE